VIRRASPRATGRRALGATIVVAAVATTVAACVDIATGPGGVESIRIDTPVHAIVVGDVLRDSTGDTTRLRATAFDANGNAIADAPFRFVGLGSSTDTTQKTSVLLVDSVTGLVRAPATRTTPIGRVAVTIGGKLQLVDTLNIVPKPTALALANTKDTALRTLAFLCTDSLARRPDTLTVPPRPGALPDTVFVGNYLPLATKLTGDSSGTALPVRSYYVRYDIVTPAGTAIPTVTLANGTKRPAIGIVRDPLSDRQNPFDTTDASGVSTAALRIFPRALAGSAFADTLIPVTVRAVVRRTKTDSLTPIEFKLRLRRLTRSPIDGTPIACPAP
jgi:hypothetical protein